MNILLISDIHGNYPALQAIADFFDHDFDLILNGGDTTVYGPFPNETINWLRTNKTLSILGNTDQHIITLLSGKTFKKPKKAEKRIMYGWTAAELTRENRHWLLSQPLSRNIDLTHYCKTLAKPLALGMYHGSPADPDEFLFKTTEDSRFRELAKTAMQRIITIGHSHSPFLKEVDAVHFINPGSVGRMFDGSSEASLCCCGNRL